jgi:hypothetical protein
MRTHGFSLRPVAIIVGFNLVGEYCRTRLVLLLMLLLMLLLLLLLMLMLLLLLLMLLLMLQRCCVRTRHGTCCCTIGPDPTPSRNGSSTERISTLSQATCCASAC